MNQSQPIILTYELSTLATYSSSLKNEKNKMINLSHMIFILNFVFTILFYAIRWTKQDLTYICFLKN
jgi:hypothetical protein